MLALAKVAAGCFPTFAGRIQNSETAGPFEGRTGPPGNGPQCLTSLSDPTSETGGCLPGAAAAPSLRALLHPLLSDEALSKTGSSGSFQSYLF